MKKLLSLMAVITFSTALSPVEQNVHGTMLPVVTIDPKIAPYYEKLATDQRICNGRQATSIRLIREGDAVTQDYSADRLNIEIDGKDTILRAWCG